MDHQYRTLLDKLDEFIRKYYKNQLLRGLIYSTTIALIFFLAVAVLEYYAHFDTLVRTFLFYLFMLSNGFILVRLVIIPLFKLNKLGKIISYDQAASIIGNHFSNVQDKLINVLQLQHQRTAIGDPRSEMLIEASINQKIKELKPVPFTGAINLSENKKYLKYALIPILLIGFILFSAPSIITDSTKRLVAHQTYFEKEAPFRFKIVNKELKTVQQEDFQLEVKLDGEEIPENVFIEVGNNEYKLNKDNTVSFNYLFKNVQQTTRFRLSADGFESQEYELTALPNPILLNFDISLDYPAYTGKKDEVLRNTGDMVVPAGTKATWNFNTQNTRALRMSFSDTVLMINRQDENTYSYSARLFRDKNYAVTTSNDYLQSKDSVLYVINVVPDLHPSLDVEERQDSLSSKRFYFRGNVKDDYGFTRLNFNYRFINKNDSVNREPGIRSESIPVNKSLTQDQFFYSWDVSKLNIGMGDEIEYYFEIWDNDGVNGSKSTRSQRKVFKAPTLKEIAEKTEKNNQEIKEDIKETIKQAKDIQKELNDLNRKVLEKNTLSWEEKKKMQDLLNKQKELQKKVESIRNENQMNNTEKSEYRQLDENILEKQKQIEDLFKNVLTEEMKEKLKELEKLMQNLDKEQMQQAIEKMKLDNKDIEKELDRTLEVFKQLEFEQKLEEAIEKLDELAKKQEDQSEKSQEKNADNKQLKEKQEDLNKEFEDIKKDIKELEKKNSELEQPNKMEKTDQQQQSIQQEMNNSSEQLKENKNKKASQSQKNASQQMQQLSQKMQQMQQEMESESNSEDMNALRDILENLIKLSFDQEALMGEVSKTRTDNPLYSKLNQKQKKLQDDSRMIEDSLLALSKRVPQIASTVNREINAINMNMGKAMEEIIEAQAPVNRDGRDHKLEAASRQQFAMTSINNLALMLNEALQQMQQQMQSKMSGAGGSCKKPGGQGQKPSAASLRKMQEQLNKQIEDLKKGMEKGGKKPGEKQGQGMGPGGMNAELAKLAAQQEAIRQQMQKIAEQLKKDGKGGGNLGNLMEKMEETETDLVNKMINQETIKRQQEILTRLLESEKAEKEREMEEKRQSNEAKNENFGNPNEFLEYNRLKLKEVELLKTVPPSLIPFYKNKVTEYFNNFEE